jgi:signal transduction histidine kinase
MTQKTSDSLTDFYGWLDKDGRIVWTSTADENPEIAQSIGADRSDRDWFINARDTKAGYASSVDDSLDGIDRLFISYPIIDSQSGSFEGVIYAGVPLAKVDNYLGSQPYSGKEITTSMMDMEGTLLQDQYSNLSGMNYLSKEYQMATAEEGEEKADDTEGLQNFVRYALANPSSGPDVADFTYGGQMASIAYSYVKIGSANFAVVFTKVPHVIAEDVEALIDQQRLASGVRMVVVGAAAVFISALVISWNRKLEKTVADRTQALAFRTNELLAANEQLKQNEKQVRAKTSELMESNITIAAQKQQLEKANEDLKHLDALKTQFIGIASHELKNPIQPIILYAEMAKYGDVDKEKAIEVILAQAQKLRQLSMDILEVSRIDSNNLILNRTKVKIGDLLQELIVPYQVDTNHEISFVLDVDHNTEMNIDVVRISQVINNILQNAIKFTRAGRITIKKRTLTDHSSDAMLQPMAEIVISDMGPGIPEDLLPKLFGKFVTQDIDGLNKHGSGLGLYISKAIIEAHGGRISAHNDEGAGASFRILLPI